MSDAQGRGGSQSKNKNKMGKVHPAQGPAHQDRKVQALEQSQ